MHDELTNSGDFFPQVSFREAQCLWDMNPWYEKVQVHS